MNPNFEDGNVVWHGAAWVRKRLRRRNETGGGGWLGVYVYAYVGRYSKFRKRHKAAAAAPYAVPPPYAWRYKADRHAERIQMKERNGEILSMRDVYTVLV